MTQSGDNEPLKRQLTVGGIWLLAINGFIGAGIFGSPAAVAGLMGPYGALLFLGCGMLMFTVILSFAEISSYFKNTGGPIQYTRRVFGPFVGFQTGWAFYVARLTAFAANVNLLVSTMGFFFEGVTGGVGRIITLFLIVGFLAWVNIMGTRQAMTSVGVLTLLKFIPLLVLVLGGAMYLSPEALGISAGTALPDSATFGTAALLVIYAFVGWEAAVIPAGESKNPVRDMPRALIGALLTVTVLYTLIQAASYAVLGDGLAATERPLVEVANAMMGTTGAILLMVGVVVSVGGNVASTIFTTPRLSYAMAREGNLPEFFARVHPAYNTPVGSILFFSVVVFVLSVYGSFVWLAALSALVRILIYMLCIATIPALRKEDRAADTGEPRFRLMGGYVIPGLAMIICAWLLISVSLVSVAVTAAFLGIGALVYFWMDSQKKSV
ncbi:MAG: APC family permease [Bacteroidetes bacterium]|nr:APC family permease [Bacteroidota bacterium]MCH8523595.1 APC family permease [Balneolales bacterium]